MRIILQIILNIGRSTQGPTPNGDFDIAADASVASIPDGSEEIQSGYGHVTE